MVMVVIKLSQGIRMGIRRIGSIWFGWVLLAQVHSDLVGLTQGISQRHTESLGSLARCVKGAIAGGAKGVRRRGKGS